MGDLIDRIAEGTTTVDDAAAVEKMQQKATKSVSILKLALVVMALALFLVCAALYLHL